ncbi:type IV secretory pathway, VirB6 component [Phenylobacterium zucineum HLK1]|uniref:Type IV secretory pathway, VirB6 component n=1 Tax=Phenylobacterium zucineum (strain HLK1) TaxID=450851 RepID=B4RFU9_PHEZH|nr:type IV secretion system protein [Phenylobacterium zucineum]ACG78762.1 type IV secretory pathway, VirB6 component [Phenylobacterium zucineum HLK1]
MDGSFRVFGPAYLFIDGRLDVFLDQGVGRAIAEVSGPLRLGLVLYVLLYGIAILRGAIAEPLMDFAVRSIKLAAIYGLATTPAYGDWITQPLFHVLPETLARTVAGNLAVDVGSAFDDFFARVAYLGETVSREASAFNWAPLLVAGGVYVFGALAAALGFGIVTLAKVALALLIALGPIFVGLSLFEATRRYFFGWLSQAVNYLVLFALILAILQLILALVAQQWSGLEGQDPVVAGLMFIALCLLAGIFFLQVPAIATGIAGGASAGLADFGNAAAGAGGARMPFTSHATRGGRTQTMREGGSVRPVRASA